MSNYTPWVEKYRPTTLDDVIGNEKEILNLKNMVSQGSIPNLILAGNQGSGKTSSILCLCHQLLGSDVKEAVLELNASYDRGISVVREKIKMFAQKKVTLKPGTHKIIILDEADSMTFDAQFALRRIIEKYSSSTRFCLICNYDNKIIPAIKSRCAEFKFNPISQEHIITKLKHVADSENLSYDKSAFQVLSNIAKGDLRKAINILNKFPKWKVIVAGNEKRETYNFHHERFKILSWLPHKKIINIYKKSSISVVPSTWEEPFGRTSLEAASRGCAVIISDRGGLKETITNGIINKKNTINNIFNEIDDLIKNKKKLINLQNSAYNNFYLTNKYICKKIDNYRLNILNDEFKISNYI